MLKRMKHSTPRYVVDRVQLFGYGKLHPSAPWLNKEMTSLLECWIKPADRGVEWFSGRSTLWLTKLAGDVTTVEENSTWAKRVAVMLEQAGCVSKISLNEVPIGAEDQANPAQSVCVQAGNSLADAVSILPWLIAICAMSARLSPSAS